MEKVARLSLDAPYEWSSTLAFLGNRAVQGIEQVEAGVYRRTIQYDGLTGWLEVGSDQSGPGLIVRVGSHAAAAASAVAERVRRMFDVDADLAAIAAHLGRDPFMARLLTAHPSRRVFRGWDGFEVAARSVIGQQVTVARARFLNGVLVDRCGGFLPGAAGPLNRLFPTPRQVLDAELSAMGMPGSRVSALKNVAAAVLAEPRLFERGRSIEETVIRLRAVPGVGEWTAHYIAMRACGEPDAFPTGDVGLLRGAADAAGRRPTSAELLARAEPWRPWRAYAAHHLWAVDSIARDGVSEPSTRVIVNRKQAARGRRQ